MGTSMYPCGCSFSTSMFSNRSGGFSICAFHANHKRVQSAQVSELREIVNETYDEWAAWDQKMKDDAEAQRAEWVSSGAVVPL